MPTSDAPIARDRGREPALHTFSPEEVATQLGTSGWWVREQVRRGRVAHLRLGKRRIRFSAEHVAALVHLVSVEPQPAGDDGPAATPDVTVLGASRRSVGPHRRFTGQGA